MASSSNLREFQRTMLEAFEDVQETSTSEDVDSGDGRIRTASLARSSSANSSSTTSSSAKVPRSRHEASRRTRRRPQPYIPLPPIPRSSVASSESSDHHSCISIQHNDWSLIENLCAKLNIRIPRRSLDGSSDGTHFRVESELIRILRCAIQTEVSANDTSEDLRQSADNVLRLITLSGASEMTKSAGFPEDLEARHEPVFKEGVEFKQLQDIFLCGELVYVKRPELTIDNVPGWCGRVRCCDLMDSDGTELLSIEALEWSWDATVWNFRLISRTMAIEEYAGRVSVQELGIIPIAMMAPTVQADVRKKLISRGKQHLSLFKSRASFWEYHGPATHNTSSSIQLFRPTEPTFTHSKTKDFTWGPIIKSRVIVSTYDLQVADDDDKSPYVMDTSEPIHDETYMMFSPYVWIRIAMSRRNHKVKIHLDCLSPVSWRDVELGNKDEKACVQILSALRANQPFANAHPQHADMSSRSKLVVIYGDMIRTTSIVRAAERDKKVLVETDLFDCVEEDELNEIQTTAGQLDLAVIVQGLVLLQNFAPLVARRSYGDRSRCEEITNFIELLEAYPGPIILCLEKDDTIDDKLRKLGPVYINLDDACLE